MRRISDDDLVTLALGLVDEIARTVPFRPVQRPDWLRIVLAWLCLKSGGDPDCFHAFWRALAHPNRSERWVQSCRALEGIYAAMGGEWPSSG
jgi:hypothetical protein